MSGLKVPAGQLGAAVQVEARAGQGVADAPGFLKPFKATQGFAWRKW
jgi:hypothetical protein